MINGTSLNRVEKKLLYKTFSLLDKKEKNQVTKIVFLQIIINVLDLVSIICVGFLGLLSMQAISGKSISERFQVLEGIYFLRDLSFSTQIGMLGFVVIATLVLKTLSNIIVAKRAIKFLSNKTEELSRELFDKVFRQNYSKIRDYLKEDIFYLSSECTNAVTFGIIGASVSLISDIALLLMILFLLMLVSPFSTIIFVAFVSMMFVLLQKRFKLQASENLEEANNLRKSVKFGVDGITSNYREHFVAGTLDTAINQAIELRVRLVKKSSILEFLPVLHRYLFEIGITLFGFLITIIEFIRTDAVTAVTTLGMFLISISRIAPSLLRIQQNSLRIQSSKIPAQIFMETVLSPPIYKKENYVMPFEGKGHMDPRIVVENLSFCYPNQSAILNSVSFQIDFGTVNCVSGKSGVGKSTLVDLLIGLLEPTSGSVTISGLSPLEAIKSWPNSISYVPQRAVFFNGTIREYLSFGLDEFSLTEKRTKEVLRKVNVWEKVESLPKGLNTEIGFNGGGVSGGEFQRLAIARALLHNPKILILDESTNALDKNSERKLLDLLISLKGSITIILIAHSDFTLEIADNLITVEGGSVNWQSVTRNFVSKKKD